MEKNEKILFHCSLNMKTTTKTTRKVNLWFLKDDERKIVCFHTEKMISQNHMSTCERRYFIFHVSYINFLAQHQILFMKRVQRKS